MFERIRLLFSLLYQGQEIANAAKWRSHQITAAQIVALVAVLVTLAKSLGYTVPLSDSDQASIGVALYALLNWLLTTVTSREHGLPAKPVPDLVRPPQPVAGEDPEPVRPVDQADSSATRQPNLDTDLYRG